MLIRIFREQVQKQPDKLAVKAGEENLTYGLLDTYSDWLSRHLLSDVRASEGKKPVALLLGQNEKMIISIFAALKAGMIYIPCDPTYPPERLRFMLADAGAGWIVTDKHNIQKARQLRKVIGTDIRIIDVMQLNGQIQEDKTENVESMPGQPAYILYTSGSTGKPKGVVQTQENIGYYTRHWVERFSVSPRDRVAQFASFSHDGAVPDIYSSLLTGATLYVFDVKQRANIESPARWLNKEEITIWHSVPTWYRYFVNTLTGEEVFTFLRLIVLGGEPVREHDIEMFDRHFPKARFGNIYGQTESTVTSIWLYTPGELVKKVMIGEPIGATELFVINKDGSPVDVLEVGEIIIAGHYLSPGYLNRVETTIGVFASDEEFGTLYWTGDQGRQLANGGIEIMGRQDHQVKVRGFRIEPGEVESVLLQHRSISETVVTARENSSGGVYGSISGDRNLWAYFVSADELTIFELREFLAGKLPDYMVPDYFVKLKTMPLTPTGKIDRNSLDAHGQRLGTGTPFAPPGSEIEAMLTETWKYVLKLEKIGIDDNFFELGGNSMDVISLNTELQNVFNRPIPAVAIFQHMTIRSFARFLDHGQMSAGEVMDEEPAISETGDRKGLEIAVIGMAGRFPGANSIGQFWENLKQGKESIAFYSTEELEESGVSTELLEDPCYVRAQSNLEGGEFFDAAFFGYTPREAAIMDPQMRIFHECVYHALEDAGYDPEQYDRKIGLYAGAAANYNWLAFAAMRVGENSAGLFAARQLFDKDYLCTRVAYNLNLRGPAVSVQTACSTSLVAIHMACRDLSGNQCDLALAGGVSGPNWKKEGYLYTEGMIFSADGHNRTFDAEASGTIFGPGVGVVALKRLEDAHRHRDHIYAVVKGTAVNNDGRQRGGFTAPGIRGEADVIRCALAEARVQPRQVGYIEAHGTATALGDPIEIEGLKQAFDTEENQFCAIGSVKSNVGHLNIASGVSGFIKTALMLKHGLIPPSIHYHTPNPAIDFKNSPFYVNTALTKWKTNGSSQPRRAGVSSFGIGGTNAHVVLEEVPNRIKPNTIDDREFQLLLLSARTPQALKRMTDNTAAFFAAGGDITLAGTAFTLAVGRRAFEHRCIIVAAGKADAVEKLSAAKPGGPGTLLTKYEKRPVIFMFSGLGSHYENMGRDLYDGEPLFRESMDKCFTILKPLMKPDLKELLYPDGRTPRSSKMNNIYDLNHPLILQPAMFAFQYSLAVLLMSKGIEPLGLAGYSFGEYTAACVSGVFSLEDALALIVSRGKLVENAPPGAMLSVPLPAVELTSFLNNNELLSLAIDNGPSSIVAGSPESVDAFEKKMKERRVVCMRIKQARAIHSNMMAPIRDEFREFISEEIELMEPGIPFISNVTGDWAVPGLVTDPVYWAAHLSGTVKFSKCVENLMEIENALFLEIGPGRDLSTLLVRHIGNKPDLDAVHIVRHREQDVSDIYFLLNRIGRMWLMGVDIDWTRFYSGQGLYRESLPGYPFESTPYPIGGDLGKRLAVIDELSDEAGPQAIAETPGVLTDGITGKRPELDNAYCAPRSPVEEQIARVWAEFFGFAPIGIDDDFFELGGDSLKGLIVITNINKRLGVHLVMEDFIKNTTIRGLAKLVPHQDQASEDSGLREAREIDPDLVKRILEPVSLLNRSLGDNLFCFPSVMGYGIGYQSLAAALEDYSLYAFNFIEEDNRLNTYIQLILEIQPLGPYTLLGYSAGGKLTFEMAGAMEARGMEISDVILLDYFRTAERVEGDPEGAMRIIGDYIDELGADPTGDMKARVLGKVRNYRSYYIEPIRVETIKGNVHLILSEENRRTPHARCWESVTCGYPGVYHGYGRHNDMVNPGPVEKNVEIIRAILKKQMFEKNKINFYN